MPLWSKIILAGLGVIAVAVGSGVRQQRKQLAALIDRVTTSAGSIPDQHQRFDDLPPPVARYLRHVLRPAQRLQLVRIGQIGTLRTDVRSERWMTFGAEHVVAPLSTSFVWSARVRVAPLVHVRVRDAFIDGLGTGQVSLLSAFTVAGDAGTPEMNAGSLHRYLAEAVWYPTALIPSEKLRWTSIDANTALAMLTDHGVSVSWEFASTIVAR